MTEMPCYESSQLSRRALLAGAGVLLAILGGSLIVSLVFMEVWWPEPRVKVERVGRGELAVPPPSFAGASLNPALPTTRARVEARWQAQSQRYAPIPGEPEAARIPVERAIELVLAGRGPRPAGRGPRPAGRGPRP